MFSCRQGKGRWLNTTLCKYLASTEIRGKVRLNYLDDAPSQLPSLSISLRKHFLVPSVNSHNIKLTSEGLRLTFLFLGDKPKTSQKILSLILLLFPSYSLPLARLVTPDRRKSVSFTRLENCRPSHCCCRRVSSCRELLSSPFSSYLLSTMEW